MFRQKRIFVLSVVLCLALFFGSHGSLAYEYDINIIEDPSMLNVEVRGVTADRSIIVGYSENGGFKYEGGAFTPFVDGANATYPMDISNNGTYIVGYTVDQSFNSNYETGFIHTEAGGFESRAYPGHRSIINGVNNSGICVGVFSTGTEVLTSRTPPSFSGYITNGTVITDINYPNAEQTMPWDINDHGDVVGYYYEADDGYWHGFKYSMGSATWQNLDVVNSPVSTLYIMVTGINNNGDYVGIWMTGNPSSFNGREPVLGYLTGNQTENEADRASHIGMFVRGDHSWGAPIGLLAFTRAFRVTDNDHILGGCPSFKDEGTGFRIGFTLTASDTVAAAMPAQPSNSALPTASYSVASYSLPAAPVGANPFLSVPCALNNNGTVVGALTVTPAEDPIAVPYVWDGTGTTPVEIATGYGSGYAWDINDNGVIAGFVEQTLDSSQYYVFTKEETGPLAFESYLDDIPYGNMFAYLYFPRRVVINNNDKMATNLRANTYDPGVVWERGQFDSTVRTIRHRGLVLTTDINDYDWVAGTDLRYVPGTEPDPLGFLWHSEQYVDTMIARDGEKSPAVMGVNNSGVMCGNMVPHPDNPLLPMTRTTAVVWEGVNLGGSYTTHTLDPPAGFEYAVASDINDDGAVVGWAYNNVDQLNAFQAVIWLRENDQYGAPILLDNLMEPGYHLTPVAAPMADWTGLDPTGEALLPYFKSYFLSWPFHPKINNNYQISSVAINASDEPLGVLLSPATGCTEQTGGNVDVLGVPYCADNGNTFEVPLMIDTAPTIAPAFGFEVTFDPAVLQFHSVVSDLDGILPGAIAGYDYWEANLVAPGVIRIAGVTLNNAIAIDDSGILCYVRFTSLGAQQTEIGLQNLVDGMSTWSTSSGCLSRADGDINRDGDLTPQDALCALEKASYVCETSCGPCEGLPCDVDMDCNCTASDTTCILYKYLELPSCLDDLP